MLSQVADVYAVDLAGWGFAVAGFAADAVLPLGAQDIHTHTDEQPGPLYVGAQLCSPSRRR